jgi:hypothetical protein
MHVMKTTLGILTLSTATAGLLLSSLTATPAADSKAQPQPLVQLAILLDTSGSMEGLIEQAKGQLWKIVNEFIAAKQNGQRPEVHVALYEYGKSSLAPASGWIRQIQPLTTDLDKISEELFALKTNGGDEYCGWVIKDAVKDLAWSPKPDVYKAIFIAGNEPFTQGPVNYADSCKAAIGKGIIVNTIHCGDQGTGISTKWQDGAALADGKYMFIDQNRAVVHFEAPQDKEIAQLGVELNKTYVAYGRAGGESAARQSIQDANAFALAPQGAAVNRALTKASANYRNDNWDLVDAVKESKVKLEQVNDTDLPEDMKKLTPDERKAFLEAKARQRTEIQAKINTLNAERSKYVAAQMKAQAGTNTLDSVMVTTIREQAQKRNFKFE